MKRVRWKTIAQTRKNLTVMAEKIKQYLQCPVFVFLSLYYNILMYHMHMSNWLKQIHISRLRRSVYNVINILWYTHQSMYQPCIRINNIPSLQYYFNCIPPLLLHSFRVIPMFCPADYRRTEVRRL